MFRGLIVSWAKHGIEKHKNRTDCKTPIELELPLLQLKMATQLSGQNHERKARATIAIAACGVQPQHACTTSPAETQHCHDESSHQPGGARRQSRLPLANPTCRIAIRYSHLAECMLSLSRSRLALGLGSFRLAGNRSDISDGPTKQWNSPCYAKGEARRTFMATTQSHPSTLDLHT